MNSLEKSVYLRVKNGRKMRKYLFYFGEKCIEHILKN